MSSGTRAAKGASRTSKRKRDEACLEVPSVGMRLCVNDRAVPMERKDVLNTDGSSATLDFVLLTSRQANLNWLTEPLGR